MDELRDVMRVFRFLTRLKDFKNFSRGQKLKTGAVGTGLLASIFGFFSGGGEIPLEDFRLTASHQMVNASCMATMESHDAEFNAVYDGEFCGCASRQWAARFHDEDHPAFTESYDYLIKFYNGYTAENDDYSRMDADLVRDYTVKGGVSSEPKILRRSRMESLVEVTNICTNYESFQGDAFKRMISLPVKGESLHKTPQELEDGRVQIALRGDIKPVALAVIN